MKNVLLDVVIGLGVTALALLVGWSMQPKQQSFAVNHVIETDETAVSQVNTMQKDKAFENFVVEKFDFTRDGFVLVEQNDQEVKTRTDLLVEIEGEMMVYTLAIECIWIESLSSKGVYLANDVEMKHIMESAEAEDARLFLIVGVGGTPTSSRSLYVAPIKYHYEHMLTPQQLANFEVKIKAGSKFTYNGKVLTLE